MPIKSQESTIRYDGNCNVYPICHHLQDIHNRNVHDLDLTFSMGQGQIENMQIENRCTTLYDDNGHNCPICNQLRYSQSKCA